MLIALAGTGQAEVQGAAIPGPCRHGDQSDGENGGRKHDGKCPHKRVSLKNDYAADLSSTLRSRAALLTSNAGAMSASESLLSLTSCSGVIPAICRSSSI